jgi:site-specific DNA-methyltransferase (adenine-specific)
MAFIGKREVADKGNPECIQVGNATLYYARMEDVLPLLASQSVDCVLTDPPYKYLESGAEWDTSEEANYDESNFAKECKRLVRTNGFVGVFGRGTSFYHLCMCLANEKFKFKEEIIWDKGRSSSMVTALARRHEICTLWSMGGKINRTYVRYEDERGADFARIQDDLAVIRRAVEIPARLDAIKQFIETGKKTFDIEWEANHSVTQREDVKKSANDINRVAMVTRGVQEKSILYVLGEHNKMKHPTAKPPMLGKRILNLCMGVDTGGTVLDTFMGSGAFGIAAIQQGRKFIGIEMDREYFTETYYRFKEASKQKELFWQ